MSLHFDAVSLHLHGQPILNDIQLRLAAGEQAALIGPSGAGKSSLLALAATLLPVSSGRLMLLQQPASVRGDALRALRRRIGLAQQQPAIARRQRVATAISAGRLGRMGAWAALRNLLSLRDIAGIASELHAVQLIDKLWQPCAELSGGQLQRVGLARLLYQQPELYLADEPVAALDPMLAAEMLALLCQRARQQGGGLLVSLHHVELARRYFPRLIGLRAGRIVFDLPTAQVSDERLAALYAGEAQAAPGPMPSADELPRAGRC